MKTIVLLSGGQDSTTVLYLMLTLQREVIPLYCTYGQRHRKAEEASVRKICGRLGLSPRYSNFNLSGESSNLLAQKDINQPSSTNPELPSSFVPARNLVFLSIALNLAAQEKASIAIGANSIDYSGYPDCRPEFLNSFHTTAGLAIGVEPPLIEAPLLFLAKWQIWALAKSLDILDIIIDDTTTCYIADEANLTKHEWGWGCGECPACKIRKNSYYEFLKRNK